MALTKGFRGWAPCALLLALAGCAAPGEGRFEVESTAPPRPWTDRPFADEEDRLTFAVFSDLNGGEREGVFSVAAAQLALLRPELVMSVGDLIDGPTPDAAALGREWDSFDRRARTIPAPVFYVGGNHDLTGRALRDVWADRYGPHYYHFVYEDVLFLVLDTEDHTPERMREMMEARSAAIRALDAGVEGAREMEYFRMPERVTGNVGPGQSESLRAALAEHPDVRWTMLFMHKPVWRAGDPDFVALEEALSERPYTVFYGHLHSLSHTVRHGRDYIGLGTTGGAQGADDPMAFDHVTLVTVTDEGPSIAHLRMDGILGKDGTIPAGGSDLCFQRSRCGQRLELPPRAPDAPSGSAFARSVEGLDLEARDERIVSEVLSGNVPGWLRGLRPVPVGGGDGRPRVELWVTPDYLAVGSDRDYLLTPMTPRAAQRIADSLGMSLPTPAMVDAVWAAADLKMTPSPIAPGPEMTTVPVFAAHSALVRAEREARVPMGALVAGHKKDVVVTAALESHPGRVAIYGWHRQDGEPIQPLWLGHTEGWVDYSHGVRLVSRSISVDGRPTDLWDALADPALAGVLSAGGVVRRPRYPAAYPR